MLASVLPAPKQQYSTLQDVDEDSDKRSVVAAGSSKVIPAYLNRKGFIPIDNDDFGDGGAFPEIHIVQYPLNMGRPGAKNTSVVALEIDDQGKVRYDAIVKQGSNRNKIVQSTIEDIKERKGNEEALRLPSQEEEEKTAEVTRKALESLLQGKITLSKPTGVTQVQEKEPEFIRYTPNPSAPGYSAAAKQRVIKMVEAQVDPLEPSKHEYKKAPRGSSSPPIPVLHSPPRKLTVADQQAWKVPPCVSNWKNAKGFIIPLDKRLAADGRGLQEVTINNKFANLSEALYVAERKAGEDLRIRNQIRKKMAMHEKEDRERELREMASKARMERAGALGVGGMHGGAFGGAAEDFGDGDGHYQPSFASANHRSSLEMSSEGFVYGQTQGRSSAGVAGRDDDGGSSDGSRSESDDDDDDGNDEVDERGRHGESEADRRARVERERLRVQKRKERERELRLENMKGNMRKNKLDRDEGRDISEKIALGMHKGSGKLTGEAMFDSRLFNQSSGMTSGFGADDEYNTFTKPLFDRGDQSSSNIYRPKKSDSDVYGDADAQMAKLTDTSRFKPDKGFRGAEGGSGGAGPRDAPVQFERPAGSSSSSAADSRSRRYDSDDEPSNGRKDARDDDDDPFGISDLVQPKKARRD